MKIFCIGRNFTLHAKELNNPIPERPVVFCKLPTSMLREGKPFYHPDFSKNIHFETELVLKVCKNGKHIDPKFADAYYDKVGLGIDLTARDIQQELKEKGQPWEIAKSFNHSAVIGKFLSRDEFWKNPNFRMEKNGKIVQEGNPGDMLFSFTDIIVYLSKFFTLQMGDLIFTGTPAGVGKIEIGDSFTGFIGDKEMLRCRIK